MLNRKLFVPVLAALTLCGVPQLALATGCHQRQFFYSAPVYKQAVVVKEVPVYVAAFVPVVSVGYVQQAITAYQAPAYAPAVAGYARQSYAQQAVAPDPCAEVKARLLVIEQALLQLRQGVQPPLQQQPNGQPNGQQQPAKPPEQVQAPAQPAQGPITFAAAANAVLVQHCAECHTSGKNKGEDKGSFPLVAEDGTTALKLTPEQKMRVMAVTLGKPALGNQPAERPTMPKGKQPLDNDSIGALLLGLVHN